MNVDFTETHLDTLCELKALAEKHNCSIRFGVYNSCGFIGYEKFIGYSKNIIEELRIRGVFVDGTQHGTLTDLWFELFDPNNAKCHYHSLRYSKGVQVVEYKLNDDIGDGNPLSKEAEKFLENNDYARFADCEQKFLDVFFSETEISGFEKQEHPNVPRTEMALKFFGDLVCDYLGEKRIVRVYQNE